MVWDELCADDALHWCRILQDVRWTSPRPFGVGTTREVALAPGLVRVHERYFRWDEGRGNSFFVYEANAPVFKRFAEDYVVEPDGACRAERQESRSRHHYWGRTTTKRGLRRSGVTSAPAARSSISTFA